jgi:hypothetical protein
MSPTTRVAVAPEKARPRRRTVDTTVGIKWLVPYQVRMTLERPEHETRKILTLEGCDYRPVASKPAQRERAPQVPSIHKIY